MANHAILIRHGMSIPKFLHSYGTETQYSEKYKRTRWTCGFQCPHCAGTVHSVVTQGAQQLFQCRAPRYQTSLTAGRVTELAKLLRTTWFLSIYLLSQAKTSLSPLALNRDPGVSNPTAWLKHQNLNRGMVQQGVSVRLAGVSQFEDAYLCRTHRGGKVVRCSDNKLPLVASVSSNETGPLLRIKLNRTIDFHPRTISNLAKAGLCSATMVRRDGLGCVTAAMSVTSLLAKRVIGPRRLCALPELKGINTALCHIKIMLMWITVTKCVPSFRVSHMGHDS